jgi:hypothetical protein
MDLQRLGQRVVDRDVVVTKFLPQHLFGMGLVKVGRRRVGTMQPLLRTPTTTSGEGGAAWDVDASTSCVGRCDVTQPSSRISSTSGARSGADPGRPLDWPHPGEHHNQQRAPSRSWSPVGRLSERACPRPCGGAWGTSACDVAAAASSCCSLVTAAVTRGGSLVAAAVRGTLAERHLVVAGVPNLSALAGARPGMVRMTLSAKKQKSERRPLEIEGA